MWVVKLGGSLWNSDYLSDWLGQLANHPGRVVVVPGGGPFSDQVRVAQARWRFDDQRAHAMALLAMEQMGQMLCGLHAGFRMAADVMAIADTSQQHQVPVWMPSAMVMREPSIAASWAVTSDSLALWLGAQILADGVLLVKSADLPGGLSDVSSLQRSGIVDDAFDLYAAPLAGRIHLLHAAHSGSFDAVLRGDSTSDVRLAG